MPNVHPLLVHFPIALIFIVVACDLIGLITKREPFIFAGTVVTVFAALGAVVTVISGLVAEETVEHVPQIGGILETHKVLAFIYFGILAILVVYRLALGRKLYGRAAWFSLAVSIVAAVVVSMGGYYGGTMVYTFGAGVQAVQKEAADDEGQNDKPHDTEMDDPIPRDDI